LTRTLWSLTPKELVLRFLCTAQESYPRVQRVVCDSASSPLLRFSFSDSLSGTLPSSFALNSFCFFLSLTDVRCLATKWRHDARSRT
jgi:hypothetical protein